MNTEKKIIDTTLREGEQAPGVLFSLAEKKLILDHLQRIGVNEVELGIISTYDDHLRSLVDYLRRKHSELRFSFWSRCHAEDLRLAASLKPHILSLSIPVSDVLLTQKMNKDRNWARATLTRALKHANLLQLTVSVGFEDATRADKGFLLEMARLAESMGAARLRIADTVGISSPGAFAQLTTSLREKVTCELGVHTHNDFGMASANGIAALEAGAQWVDTTVLGLGERSGCARLEEVTGFLSLTCGAPYNTRLLKPLANYVSKIAKLEFNRHRPLVGDAIFTCETGLHLHGLYRAPETYEPYPPEKVGARRRLQIGSKSGRRSILNKLTHLGISSPLPITEKQITAIRDLARNKKRPLTDKEFLTMLLPPSHCKSL